MSLYAFLESKPLYYKEIDHKRVHIAYGLLKSYIKHPKVVHIVGTNGKGSTGRMISYLASKSLSVGHYSSPHILKFNERIWLNGEDISDEKLELSHKKLFNILGKKMSDSLSYFEYTTLLAFVALEECDLIVLEAGLGGEFDATNVCSKELSVITPIGVDHQAFLGDTIEQIASTKIRSIQKKVLLSPQVYSEVYTIAKDIALQKRVEVFELNSNMTKRNRVISIAKKKFWANYLVDNAMVALRALDILNISYNIDDLKNLELFGRFYPLAKNIRIDVGHNPLAAKAIEQALSSKVVLIYNSLDDKDYEEVLRILKPKVKRVEVLSINSQRVTTQEAIESALKNVGLEYSSFNNILNDDDEYLVFGSFYVVEEFLNLIKIKKLELSK